MRFAIGEDSFKNGITIFNTTLTDNHGESSEAKMTVEENGKILATVIEVPAWGKRIRFVVDDDQVK